MATSCSQHLIVTMILCIISGSFSTFSNNSTSTFSSVIQNTTAKAKKMAKYTNEEKMSSAEYMSEVGSRCTDDGFFADRDDCRKFHVCYGGIQSVRWCKEGMLWDDTKIGCSAQSVTSCGRGRRKWTRDEGTSPPPPTTTTTTQSVKSNYTCRLGATGFFADPSSCSVYHWCVLGILQSSYRCTSGLHYSASGKGCLWPKDAECEGQISPPYSPIECQSGNSGYFPDPYDCSVFHFCDGVRVQSESLLCSAGLIWSARLESCSWPHEVAECQNSCPANYSSQMRFADPVICSQYIQCVDGHLEQRTCSNNFLFDRITKTCKPYEQAECHGAKPELSTILTATTTQSHSVPNTTVANPGTSFVIKKQRSARFSCIVDGYYGDPQDCRIYHVCVDGQDFRSMCAAGLAWESLLRLCMPAHLVDCQSSKKFIPQSGSSKKKWLHSFTRAVTTTTTTTTASPVFPYALPSIFTCAGRANGYYADPVHCHKFHFCGTGWHSVMECDDGLAYSPRDNDCIIADLVDCGTNWLSGQQQQHRAS